MTVVNPRVRAPGPGDLCRSSARVHGRTTAGRPREHRAGTR